MQLLRKEERPNFNSISLNCEEAIAIKIALFGHEEVYVP
jgi:hypothetical protein